jgi:hypothetical protein
VLKSVEVTWDKSVEQGTFESTFGGASTNPTVIHGDISGRAESSASVSPSFKVDMEEIYAQNIPTTSYFMFLKYPVTEDRIRAKVGGAQKWPALKPQSHVISAVGKSVSLSADITARQTGTTKDDEYSSWWTFGMGDSAKVAVETRTLTIPSCLHGTINITDSQDKTATVTAQAHVAWSAAGPMFPALNKYSPSSPKSATITGTQTSSLPATSPTDVPRSGLYLIDSRVEMYQYGYARVYAEVLDASIFK